MTQKRILLIIGGGIAAFKAQELIRLARKAGMAVTPVLTEAAKEFVTPLSVAALSGNKAYDELFSLTDEVEMGHIELSRAADLVVVAPATADLLAKACHGLANDLASTLILATDKPVLYAPAMNVRMWEHPATQRNTKTLRSDGALFVGPDKGDMACGEYGPGRMAEPGRILETIETYFAGRLEPPQTVQALEGPVLKAQSGRLKGRRVLITSGPTHEPIDPVRFLGNRSSGKQGHALAAAARDMGADVVLISGPVSEPFPSGVEVQAIESAGQMLAAVERALPADIGIFAAAVADWRVDDTASDKIKKTPSGPPHLKLVENPDILKTIASHAQRPAVLVGFAAETDNVVAHARKKLSAKGCDLIAANDVRPETGVMGGERTRLILVDAAGEELLPDLLKHEAAVTVLERAASLLEGRSSAVSA